MQSYDWRTYQKEHRAEYRARARSWYHANRDKILAGNKTPEKRARAVVYSTAWVKRNRATYNANNRAFKVRTPKWANPFFISEAYALAQLRTKLTGYEWHVDHIVPVRGRNVCGLHVENNLCVMPATMNRQKSNRFEMGAS